MSSDNDTGARRLDEMIRESFEQMPELSRTRTRSRVLASLDSAGRIARARVLFARTAVAFTTSAALLTGTGLAAAASLPGDLLYPVKRATEEVRVAFAPAAEQGGILLEMVQSRVREVTNLVESDASEPEMKRAAEQFGTAASRAIMSDPDPKATQEIVREIEASVAEEPRETQQRVDSEIPAPAPAPSPSPNPRPTNPNASPSPQPDPTPSPDPQGTPQGDGSGSSSGPQENGSGSGGVSRGGN